MGLPLVQSKSGAACLWILPQFAADESIRWLRVMQLNQSAPFLPRSCFCGKG
jgi:hypothetical protein